jgi:DNA-binding CsgD family transcriptional regulator
MSSKEIAALMNITTRGVEISRYRLRRKLDIERTQNLIDYILSV